jgi:hypothetical protein
MCVVMVESFSMMESQNNWVVSAHSFITVISDMDISTSGQFMGV